MPAHVKRRSPVTVTNLLDGLSFLKTRGLQSVFLVETCAGHREVSGLYHPVKSKVSVENSEYQGWNSWSASGEWSFVEAGGGALLAQGSDLHPSGVRHGLAVSSLALLYLFEGFRVAPR